jgi:putative nucleotidyltransferase with HDIG domain
LQHVLPHVFHRALFSAWLGSLIASQRELEPQDIRLVFQAGLFHDLGLLHIDATLAGKKTAISAAEWASIQSHVGIGATIVQHYGVNDERLAQVIAQHHERADGAGYPHGETDTDIDPAALIIALGDMIHALRFPGLPACSATFADCLPFLRVNRLTFGEANNLAATRILLCARYAVTENGSEARTCPAVHELIEANLSLGRLLHSIAALHRLLDGERGEGLAARIGSLVTQVQWISMSSGLGTGTLGKWLESNAPESAADAGLREIQSTTREVLWLLRRIERLLVELLASGEPRADAVALESLASGFSAELARAWQFSAPHG